MKLPLGTWILITNGRQRILTIQGVDAVGKLDLTLEGVPVIGYWDPETRRILFEGPTEYELLPEAQFNKTYVGYLLDIHQDKASEVPTLAGYFDYRRGSDDRPYLKRKKTYGWYAQLYHPGSKVPEPRRTSRRLAEKNSIGYRL